MDSNLSDVSQNNLEKIFSIHYNDLFSKFLTTNNQDLFTILKKQVLLHLKIIGKQYKFQLLSFFFDKYYNIFQAEQIRLKKIFIEINKISSNNYKNKYLNIYDVYIHCFKCNDAVHKCGNKLIIFDDLIFCLKCKKVYNKNQIKLFCKECKKTYLTCIRNFNEIKTKSLYRVAFMNYHCFSENEELIKCLNCGNYLYYDINNTKKNEITQKRIIDIYCVKCKLIFDTTKIYFPCKICGKNFKSEPQIYRNFSSHLKYMFLLIHSFMKEKYALPSSQIINNKSCNCNLNGILYYMHDDNGILFEGKKNGTRVITCNACYKIFKYDTFIWNCPFCGIKFNNDTFIKNKNQLNKMNNNKNFMNNRYIGNINNSILSLDKNYRIENKRECNNNCPIIHKRGLSMNNRIRTNYLNLNENNYHQKGVESNRQILNNKEIVNNSDFNNYFFINNNIQNNYSYNFPKNTCSLNNSKSFRNLKESLINNYNRCLDNNKTNKYFQINNFTTPNQTINTSKNQIQNFNIQNNRNNMNVIMKIDSKKYMKQNGINKKEIINNNVLYESKSIKNRDIKHVKSMANIKKYKININNDYNINHCIKLIPNKNINSNIKRKDIKYINQNKNNKSLINSNLNNNLISKTINECKNKKIFKKKNARLKENELLSYKIKRIHTIANNNNSIHISMYNSKNNSKNKIAYKSLNTSKNKNNYNNTSQKNIVQKTNNIKNNTKLFIDNMDNNKISFIFRENFIQPIHKKNNLSININNLNCIKRNKIIENTKLHYINEKRNNNSISLNKERNNSNRIYNIYDHNRKINLNNNFNYNNNFIKIIEVKNKINDSTKKRKLIIKKIDQIPNNKSKLIFHPYHKICNTDIKSNENSNKNIKTKMQVEEEKQCNLNFSINNYIPENKDDNIQRNNVYKAKVVNQINNNINKNINISINENENKENKSNKKEQNKKEEKYEQKIKLEKPYYKADKQNNIISTEKNIIKLSNKFNEKKMQIKPKISLIELKLYFSGNLKLNDLKNPKRKSSFDCRLSTSHFKLFNSQDIEQKTFDSNYYKIIRQIGKGTFGEIYLVQDPKNSKFFALKKIIINDATELRDNQEEYKLTWKLTHINPELKIVKKYGIEIKKLDKYNIVMYILMEASNCDWEKEIINRQKVQAYYQEIELLTILKSLVKTFKILQTMGISHRDVKPQNILCFGENGYKLTDFGEAKKRNVNISIKNIYGFEKDTTKQTLRGTELYMSPLLFKALRNHELECLEYNAYKSDVFSLGMCFLFASSLTYESLFDIREENDMKKVEEVIEKFLGKLYSKDYANIIIKMLQIDEKNRPDFIELSKILEIN